MKHIKLFGVFESENLSKGDIRKHAVHLLDKLKLAYINNLASPGKYKNEIKKALDDIEKSGIDWDKDVVISVRDEYKIMTSPETVKNNMDFSEEEKKKWYESIDNHYQTNKFGKKIFEEWNKERFASKEDAKDYYRDLNPIKSVEERTYTPDQLKDFDIPDEMIKEMESWDVIVKSPYSNTFYNSKEISWSYKPDGSFRVSDHWNFEAKGGKHCLTDSPVTNTTYLSLGQYDKKRGRYKILMSLPKPSFLQKLELGRKKKEFMKNPEIIELKKDFKNRIENKEIIGEVIDKGKSYKGIVRKYTGRALKIENEDGELIYSENYLDKQVIKLFDKNGKSVADPFDIKFESRIIKTFEGFRNGVSKRSNFSVEDLEDILSDIQIIGETYHLEDISNIDRKDTAKNFEEYINQSKSFYYVNSARNAYVDIFYFGSDKDELIDDLKSFVQKMKTYGFYIKNGWSYKNGFSCELNSNIESSEYLEISLVFYKDK